MKKPNGFALVLGWALLFAPVALLAPLLCDWIGISRYWTVGLFALILILTLAFRRKDDEYDWRSASSGSAINLLMALWMAGAFTAADGPESAADSALVAQQKTVSPPATAAPSAISGAERVTVDDVLITYEKNQIAGERRFGKPFDIEGRVDRVREALGTGIMVLLSRTTDRQIEMAFSEQSKAQLGKIEPNDLVVVRCAQTVEALSVVGVIGCSDITVEK